jgi:TolB-like protein/Tfp pilus assembly protein PilF
MGRDESGTVARLRAIWSECLEPILVQRGGRLVKLTGDGALVEFASAVDAVSAAIEFQQAVADKEARRGELDALVFRIGVHLGDLIVDDNDLYGDGVNVAARLEAKAPQGGIIVSGAVHEATAGRLKANFQDRGRLRLKNIERQVQAYSVHWDVADWPPSIPASAAAIAHAAQSTIPSLSVAVLPLTNSGAPVDEHFIDGVTEDLIADLSRISGAFVTARNTSFTFKGKSVDVRQVGRELGVRFILEGSVRCGDGRVRVSVQLIDGEAGSHVWADRFDIAAEDAYALQDEVTARLARALNIELKEAVSRRAARGRPDDLEAADLATRGWAILFNKPQSQETNEEARLVLEQSLNRAPQNAEAWTGFSYMHSRAATYGWCNSSEESFQVAVEAGERAVALDPRSADAHLVLAYAVWGAHADRSRARHLLTRCLELNPNYAPGYFWLGVLDIADGHPQSTLTLLQRAFRLSPRDGLAAVWQYQTAQAQIVLGDDEAAIRAARAGIAINPKFPNNYLALAAALAHQGHAVDAGAALDRYYVMSPNRTIDEMLWATQRCHVDRRAFARYVAGLRKAGMRER